MEQLSGLNASFINQEHGNSFGHISFLALYDTSSFGSAGPYAAVRAALEERLHLVPLMKKRVVEVPLDLDLPYWINDPEFDLDFHLRHVAVPPPGDPHQLSALVGRLIGRPLDRARPLWELNVIESIEGGGVAILVKTHHAAIDEHTGSELLSTLLDEDPEERVAAPPDAGSTEPIPDSVALLQRTYAGLMTSPERLVRAQHNAMRSVGELFLGFGDTFNYSPFAELRNSAGLRESIESGVRLPAVSSPKAPFNAPITAHRRIAWRSLPLEEVRRVRQNAATTFNDVVVAVCSGGVRRYLLRKDALPERPLTALIPITARRVASGDEFQNRVTGAVIEIATDEEDPVARLSRIHDAFSDASEVVDAIPAAEVVENFSEFSTPAVAAQASRMIAGLRLPDREHPPFNLAISNVAGPREPLYTAGAELKALIPALPVSDGLGLSITTVSYRDRLEVCLVCCRELVPEVEDLADDLVAAFDDLRNAELAPLEKTPRKRRSRPLSTGPRPT